MKTKVAIVGSGNIGTDLMIKIHRGGGNLELAALVGIDPASDGLARAQKLGYRTIADGVEGLIASDVFEEVEIIFEATSAAAHIANAKLLEPYGKVLVDLTPAAIGPFVVPTVNLDENLAAPNLNMVTCGGQATIPIVAAVGSVAPVHYAEIVASISSRSAGPGTRANIDEFTETTSHAIETVGGAARGKAIIILNPSEPPMIMRDTVLTLVPRLDDDQRQSVREAVAARVRDVQQYVPGYQLKHDVQFADAGQEKDILVPEPLQLGEYTQVTVFLEVAGAADYLPAYAGNLDIMTAAALKVGQEVAERKNS